MRVVQVAVDEIVDVIPVRNRGVSAVGAVHMIVGVSAAMMVGRARARILSTDLDLMLLDLAVGKLVMQVPVVQVIDVTLVLNGRVAAIRPVFVRVICMSARHLALLESFLQRFDASQVRPHRSLIVCPLGRCREFDAHSSAWASAFEIISDT
jgi:hypothetical protein